MDKMGYVKHTESGIPIVCHNDLPEMLLKINEIVTWIRKHDEFKQLQKQHNEIIKKMKELVGGYYCDG